LLLILLGRSDANKKTNEKNINSKNVITQDELTILNDGLQVGNFEVTNGENMHQCDKIVCLFLARHPPVGQGLLI